MAYPDLPGGVATMPAELDPNGCSAEVRGHREVGDGCRRENDDGDLVEKTSTPRTLWMCEALCRQHLPRPLTIKSNTIMTKREQAITEKTAHNQSEAWVEMLRSASGGLRFKAWLAMALEQGNWTQS